MNEFILKDSGERVEFTSGMRRDTQEDKIDYNLIPMELIDRVGALMTKGAKKYGTRNWMLANSEEELERFKSSARRHLIQWLKGERDEDHAAAVCFNLFAAEHTITKINELSKQDILATQATNE